MPRWVTVFGRVNHLDAEPGTQAYSAWARPLWLGWNEYPAEAWGVNRHITWYTSQHPWSRSVRWCLAVGLACRDQHRRTGSGSTLEALRDDALYITNTCLLYFTILHGPRGASKKWWWLRCIGYTIQPVYWRLSNKQNTFVHMYCRPVLWCRACVSVLCRICGVCNRGFSEASFLRYPNGVVAHIHCANASNVSSSSLSVNSRSALTR